ncbi:Probable L-ascorbate peroxidase 7 [Durusdinium trenchii]|uniref:Chloroplastic (OsAPx7) n=1 Tax=Durusdinium trenchii TaxID=1381693 RepID=A0ABP0JXJ5_9DINO
MSWLDALVSLHHRLLPDLRRTPGLIRDVSAADGWRCGVRLLEALQRQRQRRDVVMAGAWSAALQQMQQAQEAALQGDLVSCNVLISAHGSRVEKLSSAWRAATQQLWAVKAADVWSYNAAASASSKAQQWQRAWRLLGFGRSSALQPDVISYSSSLSSATPWRLALDLLPPLRRAAVRGDGAWQNQVMVAVGESGAWRSAVQLWEASGAGNLQTFTSLLAALPPSTWPAALAAHSAAHGSWALAGGGGERAVSSNAAVGVCGSEQGTRAGQWLAALTAAAALQAGALATQMAAESEIVRAQTVLGACGTRWRWALSYSARHDTPRAFPAGACGRAGCWEVAEALLRGDAWNVALAAWAQHGLWRRSLWRWQDTDAVGRRTVLLAAEKSQANLVARNTALSAVAAPSAARGRWRQAVEAFAACGAEGVLKAEDSISFNALLRAFESGMGALAWHQGLQLLRAFQASHLEPRVITFSAMVAGCQQAMQWRWALRLEEELIGSALQPSVVTAERALAAVEADVGIRCRWLHSTIMEVDMSWRAVDVTAAAFAVPGGAESAEFGGTAVPVRAEGMIEWTGVEFWLAPNCVAFITISILVHKDAPFALPQKGRDTHAVRLKLVPWVEMSKSSWQRALAELEASEATLRTCNQAIASSAWHGALLLLNHMLERRVGNVVSCNSGMGACATWSPGLCERVKSSYWRQALLLLRHGLVLRHFEPQRFRGGTRRLQRDGVTQKQAAQALKRGAEASGQEHWPEARALGKGEALGQLSEVATRGLEMDVKSFGLALSLWQSAGRWPDAQNMLRQMTSAKVQVDCRAYSAAMGGAPWTKSAALLQDLQWQLEADEFVYNTVMSSSPWKKARRILQLQQLRLQASIISYNAGLVTSPWPEALEALQRAKTEELPMTKTSFGALLAQSRHHGYWPRALWLLSSAQRQRVALEGGVAECNVAAAQLDAGGWKEVLHFLSASASLDHQRRGPGVGLKTMAMKAFSEGHAWPRSLEVFDETNDRDVVMLNALVTCYAQVALWEKALQVLGSVLCWSLRATVVTFNAAVSACAAAREWQKALGLWSPMLQQDVRPDDVTLNSFLLAAQGVDADEWSLVLQLLSAFSLATCQLNVISYSTAITACPAARWPLALSLAATRGVGGGGVAASRAAGRGNCHPILVRLAWHDSGTYDQRIKDWPQRGGANGLDKARGYLETIQKNHPSVSWADLIQLASATAIEMAGGPVIKMKYGRVSVTDPSQCAGPASREGFKGNAGLPDAAPPFGCGAQKPEEHLRNVFGKKMGFTDQEIVALSGAHTLGRVFKERSGACPFGYGEQSASKYTKGNCIARKDGKSGVGMVGGGAWTKNWLTFDNSYFANYKDAMDDDDLIWLPTDEVLHNDPEFKKYFYKYAGDQNAFFQDYALAHKKLSELGAKFDPPSGFEI